MEHAEAANIEGTDRGVIDRRLEWLIAENHRIAREKVLYRNDRERVESLAMRRPIKIAKAYRYFGLMLGSVPPAAMAMKMLVEDYSISPTEFLFFVLIIFAGLVTGTVGYFSGKQA